MFFMAYQPTTMQHESGTKRIFIPKQKQRVEHACFSKTRAGRWHLPNPSGTVKHFLQALQQEEGEEALSYLSASVLGSADAEQLQKLFEKKTGFHFISDNGGRQNIRTVNLACVGEGGETEIIEMRMVAEPNEYGKWKIYHIERE